MVHPESKLLTFGALSAGLRAILPPVIDAPFVRAVRGAMIDRVVKEAGYTLSAEARKVLLELDDPMSARGIVERGARWIVARVVPGAGVMDAASHLLTTFGAGALLRRYVQQRTIHESRVIDGVEAAKVQRALRIALDVTTVEHARGLTKLIESVGRAAMAPPVAVASKQPEGNLRALARRATEVVGAGLDAVPSAYTDVLEPIFRRELEGK